MENEYQKKSYKLFFVWIAVFFAVLIWGAVKEINIGGIGAVQSNSLLACVMLDLLFLLIYLTDSIYWINGVTYEEAAQADAAARKRYAWRHLLTFLVATAIYFVYCIAIADVVKLGSIGDSLVAGGVLCVAGITTIRIHL